MRKFMLPAVVACGLWLCAFTAPTFDGSSANGAEVRLGFGRGYIGGYGGYAYPGYGYGYVGPGYGFQYGTYPRYGGYYAPGYGYGYGGYGGYRGYGYPGYRYYGEGYRRYYW